MVRLNVDQYHRLLDAGILPEGEPVELLDGILVRKDRRDGGGDAMIHGPRHASLVAHWYRFLDRAVEPFGCHARCQLPITLPPSHEPEPDISIVDGAADRYLTRHPEADDTLLVIEAAESSLELDRSTKQAVYAGAAIPRYWILNPADGCIEVYADPVVEESRYATHGDIRPGEKLTLPFSDRGTVEIEVSKDLLPGG